MDRAPETLSPRGKGEKNTEEAWGGIIITRMDTTINARRMQSESNTVPQVCGKSVSTI